jgi:hypothetical protein
MFYIDGLKNLDNEIVTYKNNDIIDKIKKEENQIISEISQKI